LRAFPGPVWVPPGILLVCCSGRVMRKASFIVLATVGSLGCSGRRLQAGDDGGSAGGGGHGGAGVTSAGGSTGTAGGGAAVAGGAGAGGGAAAAGGAGVGGGTAARGGAGVGAGGGVAGGAGTTGVGGGGMGGSGPTGGTGGTGGSGSSPAPPRFLLIGPMDPSGSLQAGREYTVLLNGASDDGSVLVGSSTFYAAATSTTLGLNFYWSEASGVVTLASPSNPSRAISPWPHVSPDGTSVFGLRGGRLSMDEADRI